MLDTELNLESSTEAASVSPDPLAPTVEGSGEGAAIAPPDPPLPKPKKPKKKRGGKRPGAGRPKKSKVKSPFGDPATPIPDPTQPPQIEIGSFADMGHVAAVGTAALDGVIVGVARMRYGEAANELSANKKALGDIQAAMLVYLEHTAIKITPGQALLVAIGAAYGPPAMALELQRRADKKTAPTPMEDPPK